MTMEQASSQKAYRFAPSPNGELHLGHAYSALLNLKMARKENAKMLLRIEDIDQTRCTPELETQMLRDLEWIGFEWDEEPVRQSERFELYRAALDKFSDTGLTYPSIMSRSEIKAVITSAEADGTSWPRDPDGAPFYPGIEKSMDANKQQEILDGNQPYSIRLNGSLALDRAPEAFNWTELSSGAPQQIEAKPESWGDIVLARKDVPASYHLCCVVDDAHQCITTIVRGKDLYHATGIQRLLQHILGAAAPGYFHHDLIVDETGRKLSKSNRDTSLKQLRQQGRTPQDIRTLIGL